VTPNTRRVVDLSAWQANSRHSAGDAPDPGPASDSADLIYHAAMRGANCWARNHLGQVRALPINRWLGGPASAPHDRLADEQVLAHCNGKLTLDLGCGPGRFTASLQQRGSAALGVDTSIAAVELTRLRGGTAIHGDLFAPLPAEGLWDQILLTDGNIGIGGDPVRTLRRAAALLAEGGVVIVEVDLAHHYTLRRETLRWETAYQVGPWFPWSRVGAAALGEISAAAGFLVTSLIEIHSRVIAVLAATSIQIFP
jgi:SAM-dependent methyltransferase